MTRHLLFRISNCAKCRGMFSLVLMSFWLWMPSSLVAQQAIESSQDSAEFYREDQFYFALSYDLLTEVPNEVASRGLVGGVQFGFIRDWPLSQGGDWSLGTGLGMSYDRYGSNVVAREGVDAAPTWTVEQSPSAIDANSLRLTAVEFPLEIRWRSSTPLSYKFWRLYAGVKWSQHLFSKTVFSSPVQSETLSDLPQLRSGIWYATVSFGFGTFNAQIQWGLSPLLEGVQDSVTQQSIGLRPIKLGIMFYIL